MSPSQFENIDGFRTSVEELIIRSVDRNSALDFAGMVARAASALADHMRASGASEETATAAADYLTLVGAVMAIDLAPDILTP